MEVAWLAHNGHKVFGIQGAVRAIGRAQRIDEAKKEA